MTKGPHAVRGIILRFVACVLCVRACMHACAMAAVRHGACAIFSWGPTTAVVGVGRSREKHRSVESRAGVAMAVGGPERHREGHTMQDGSGELLIFCHCKLIYSMGPLLSPPPLPPPAVHASCALWGHTAMFQSSVPSSALLYSLSLSLARNFSSSFSTLVRARARTRYLDVVAWLQRAIGCTPAALRYAVPLLHLFFIRQKRHLVFFSRSSPATTSKNLLALRRLTAVHLTFT